MDTLQLNPLDKGSPNMKFPITDSWKKRAVDCLLLNQTLMTTIEILRCIMGAKEFGELAKDQRSTAVTNLSVTLNNLTKEGYIKKIRIIGLKGNYYGLANWFEPDGTIVKGYANTFLQTFLENVHKQPISCCEGR
jgi:hypothetical protein